MVACSDGVGQRRWLRRARRAALVASALWCVALGIGITGVMLTEGTLGAAGTVVLLGAVGMLVLPGLTALALRLDSRERRRTDPARASGGAGVADPVAHPARGAHGVRREGTGHRVRATPGRLAGEWADERAGMG